ncbi:winged helix-turn-helix domain-containing protein [Pseudomonas sp. SA3-5]|uniref:Winged helix-turn-helix domain-containing protein n=1 Tax=Pseudomonas aestuarii TaxID=3018340 RepID=A0ABT4XK50_9PSED|nr:winged helix-turn-helix domain-containing protein [Pseudomonas aestuarii]MDA7088599.1 winged helix-turn-helix domain-containing protein [Pseudomonas aestuarii]
MPYRFEEFEINIEQASLTRGDEEVALEPRAYALLLLLIRNRERVVSKDEIIEQLWQGRFTSDSAVTTCLKTLRKALQDDGERQRFIRTLRGRGFRFVAQVSEVLAESPVIVSIESESPPDWSRIEVPDTQPSALQGKPSLIVLPLQNLGDDPFSALMSEAMAHDVIQELSRLRWLRVIARGTAFRFRFPDTDLRLLGQQLKVRYALCGTISTWGARRELHLELSDCQLGDLVWADRFDVSQDRMHGAREQILARVISSLEIYVPMHEASQASLTSTQRLDSWGNYHLGLRHMYRFTPLANQQAAQYFREAIRLDSRFARAYAGLSFTRFQDAFLNYDDDVNGAIADARRFAETAVELDGLDPFTNFNLGRSLMLEGEADISQSWLERSVTLSPNFAQGHYSRALVNTLQGQTEDCIANSELALHLSPLDPLLYANYAVRALSYLRIGDMENAIKAIEKAVRTPGAHYLIQMIAALLYALNQQMDKAQYWRQQALQRHPSASARHFFVALPFAEESFRQTLSKGLRLANF